MLQEKQEDNLTIKMGKIYELTTNGMGGWRKYYVLGIKNDTEASKIAKNVFGRFYWKGGISYYDNTETTRIPKYYLLTKKKFLKLKKEYNY